jgi:hypothetical protein
VNFLFSRQNCIKETIFRQNKFLFSNLQKGGNDMNGRFRLHNSFLDPPIMTHRQNRLQHSNNNNNNNNNGIPLSPISPQTNRPRKKSEKLEEDNDYDDILNVLFQKGFTLQETSKTTFNETTPQRISYNHNNPPQQQQQLQKQQTRKNIFNTPFILKVSNIPFDLSEYWILLK